MPGEVYFYHLRRRTLDSLAPDLLEKSLERGWRVTLRAGGAERLAALDAWLWTYRDDSFLPHGGAGDPHPDRQPVYLTAGDETPNDPHALMLIDGAEANETEIRRLERVMTLFDGQDEAAVQAARGFWRRVVAAGAAAQYWAEGPDGRFAKKAESAARTA